MVNHQTFDWIFFAIVGIPLVLAIIDLSAPHWLESIIRKKSLETNVRRPTTPPAR